MLLQQMRSSKQVPAGPLSINWSHPLAHKLSAAVVLSPTLGAIELVRNRPLAFVSTSGSYRSGPGGMEAGHTSGPGTALMTLTELPDLATLPFSMFCVYWGTAGSTYNGPFAFTNIFGSAGMGIWSRINSTWEAGIVINNVSGILSGLTPFSDGRLNTIGFSCDGAASAVMCNGEVADTGAAATPATGSDRINLLTSNTSENITTGGTYCGYIWNRRLTNSELCSLHTEPYGMFQSPMRRTHLWSVAAAGGGGGGNPWYAYAQQ